MKSQKGFTLISKVCCAAGGLDTTTPLCLALN